MFYKLKSVLSKFRRKTKNGRFDWKASRRKVFFLFLIFDRNLWKKMLGAYCIRVVKDFGKNKLATNLSKNREKVSL